MANLDKNRSRSGEKTQMKQFLGADVACTHGNKIYNLGKIYQGHFWQTIKVKKKWKLVLYMGFNFDKLEWKYSKIATREQTEWHTPTGINQTSTTVTKKKTW